MLLSDSDDEHDEVRETRKLKDDEVVMVACSRGKLFVSILYNWATNN